MSEHTLTPWQLEPGAWITGEHAHRSAIVADCTHDGAISEPSQNANAAFIVKAVNSHDALVKALEEMIAEFATADEDCGCSVCKITGRAREALAKVSAS